ncbi:MAG: hypothetical protein ACKVJF_02380 [Flavobacteriales bacterium]
MSGFCVLKCPWRQARAIAFAGLDILRSNSVTPVFSTNHHLTVMVFVFNELNVSPDASGWYSC